jgi:drug/metabolite transporter (DMT)-like permease
VERMGIVLIVLGLALAGTSGFADTIGLGDERGFHYRQGIGVGVGVALAIAGVVIAVRRTARPPDSPGPGPGSDSIR